MAVFESIVHFAANCTMKVQIDAEADNGKFSSGDGMHYTIMWEVLV